MKKNLVSNENRYEENLRISKSELRELFRKIDAKLINNKLAIEGNNVSIPGDKELRIKLKYEVDKNYAFTIRISWVNEAAQNEDFANEDQNEF